MNLTDTVIKAVANLYTVEELEQELSKAVNEMLKNPDRIVSASTGAGASYTKALNMTSQELVELLTFAIEYKKNGFIGGGSNIMSFVSVI